MTAVPEPDPLPLPAPGEGGALSAGRGARRGRHEVAAAAGGSWTVGAATLLAAGLLAVCEAAGATFVIVAVTLGIGVLLWGWALLVSSPEPTGPRLAIAVTAASAVLAGSLADDGPALRHLPVAIALGLITAFLIQLVRGETKFGVVTALTSAAAGVTVVASGLALIAAAELRWYDSPLTIAAVGVACASAASLVGARWRGMTLLLAAALGAGGGVAGGLLAATAADLWVAAVLGGAAGLVATATRLALAELPGARLEAAPAVIAAASVFAPGFLVATIAKLLLG